MVQIQKKIYDNNIEETVVRSFLTGFMHFQKLLVISFLEIPKIPERVRNAQNILFRLMVTKFLEPSRHLNQDPNYLNSSFKSWKAGTHSNELFFEGFLYPLFAKRIVTGCVDDEIFGTIIPLPCPMFNTKSKRINLSKSLCSNNLCEDILIFLDSFTWELTNEINFGPESKNTKPCLTPAIFGHIFEQTIHERFGTVSKQNPHGAYYTPHNICKFLTHNAISQYLLNMLNEYIEKEHPKKKLLKSLDDLFLTSKFLDQSIRIELCSHLFFDILPNFSLLDNACGTGSFILTALDEILEIYSHTAFALLKSQSFIHSLCQILRSFHINRSWFRWNFSSYQEFREDPRWKQFFKQNIITTNVYGIDIDEDAIIIAKTRLWFAFISDFVDNSKDMPISYMSIKSSEIPSEYSHLHGNLQDNLKVTNSLVENFSDMPASFRGFSVIVGNPPYGNLLNSKQKEKLDPEIASYSDIAAMFLERSINLQEKHGVIALLITYAITFSHKWSPLRVHINSAYRTCKIATFDRDKCRFFSGMSQSISLLQCIDYNPEIDALKEQDSIQDCEFFTSEMYRTPKSFDDIAYSPANNLLLGKNLGVSFNNLHRLPKIGSSQACALLNFLAKMPRKLVQLLENRRKISSKYVLKQVNASNTKDSLIWLRSSGNYWYNAWDHCPYISSEIKYCKILDTGIDPFDIQSFLICLINSSMFYWWFRVYGDGRHMNADIMKAFPISANFSSKIKNWKPIFKIYREYLMKSMFEVFNSERNRFETSKIKALLDVGDEILGKFYGFSPKAVEFLQNYDNSIRKGLQLTRDLKIKLQNALDRLIGSDQNASDDQKLFIRLLENL